MFKRLAMAVTSSLIALVLLATPVFGRAKTSITGPDGFHFGESAGVTFDTGKSKVDPFNWWASVNCYNNGTTTVEGQNDTTTGELIYSESLHLGDQTGPPINDNLMTFGPTLSWTGGGADCTVTLQAYDNNGGFVPYASDDFVVLP